MAGWLAITQLNTNLIDYNSQKMRDEPHKKYLTLVQLRPLYHHMHKLFLQLIPLVYNLFMRNNTSDDCIKFRMVRL